MIMTNSKPTQFCLVGDVCYSGQFTPKVDRLTPVLRETMEGCANAGTDQLRNFLDYAEKAIVRAKEAGIKYIVLGSGQARNVPGDYCSKKRPDIDKGYRQFTDFCRQLCEREGVPLTVFRADLHGKTDEASARKVAVTRIWSQPFQLIRP